MATGDGRRAVEYAKCAADVAYFTDTYAVIDDAQGHGDGTGTMPFRLWPAQVGVLWTLMAERLAIILKARQLGISWLCCAYALWHCLFAPGKVVLLFSQGELEANELLRRVRVLYERLPEWLREQCPLDAEPNTQQLVWANGSKVRSLPATKKAGRSFTASLVIMDEAAHITLARSLYNALKPTIDGGGQIVVLSTANGLGNFFHRHWCKAVEGANHFRTIFLAWWTRPGRDAEWYRGVVEQADDPALIPQEYPASPTEAFIASGRLRFANDWIVAQVPNVGPGLPREAWPEPLRALDGLVVHKLPQAPPPRKSAAASRFGDLLDDEAEAPAKGPPTIIGADVAEGLERRDYSDAVVFDPESWDELASLHGHWEPDEFARRLKLLSDVYNGDVAVERNNHGHAVIVALNHLRCGRILNGHDKRPGWVTNAQTKPQAIDALAAALRDGCITIRTQAALDELAYYTVFDDGKTGAPEGYHDDRVMSRAIALAALARRLTLREW